MSLKKIILDLSQGRVLIPKQLKERGVIIDYRRRVSTLKLIKFGPEDFDDENDNDDINYVHHQANNIAEEEDENCNICNEDEITVYDKEDDELFEFY